MKCLSIGVVGPIAVFTLLAIPIHLSITDCQVRVGHYASLHPDVFLLSGARSLTIVDEHKPQGRHVTKDIIVEFADGRRFRGNQIGDGGTRVRSDVMQLLIEKTCLTPRFSSKAE
jgi:hypothetical protein